MEYKIKDWIDIYSRIAESISNPVLILDSSLEILYANPSAVSEFCVDDLSLTLDQIFSRDTTQNLSDEIGPVLFASGKKTINEFEILTSAGIKKRHNILIDSIEAGGEKIIALFFNYCSLSESGDGISIRSIDVISPDEINRNETLKYLISIIRTHLPFTLIGLKRIQQLIDEYDFPVWIKDKELKFIAVNRSFNKLFNFEESFAIGKKHETFLPQFLGLVFKTIDEYVLNTLNRVILKGFVKNKDCVEIIQSYIQVPVKDNLNKLYAIIGLINEEKNDKITEIKGIRFLNELIFNFPKAAALLNFSNFIEQANSDFCKFLGKDSVDVISKSVVDLFPYIFSENIKSFLAGDNANDELYIGRDLYPSERFSSAAKVTLIKIKSDGKSDRFLIIIDDSENRNQQENELQNIIMNRGQMFEVLIQNNPDPIFIYDKENLKFLEVNEAAIKFYGYTRDEFLQMDLTDLYAPDDIQTLLESFGEGTAEGRYSRPFRHRKKDGETVVVEISKTSFRFQEKEAHFNIVKDITASIEKEKQNQMLKVIFNSTDSLVFNTDASGFISFVNYPVIEKLGYTSNELLQSAFASLVTDDDRAFINTSIFHSQIRDDITLNTKIKKQDGEFLNAEITAHPILDFNSELESFTIIVKPDQYLITREVPREVIKEVIKEVVVEKKAEAGPADNLQDTDFLSGMFHEILTPMNVIIGFSQELVSGVDNPTDEQREAADIINQNRIKLMDTMNAVVEYSEIVQNKFSLVLENVAITDIVDKLDKNVKEIAGVNEIKFSYGKISSSLSFITDRQKFENLIFLLIKLISRISSDKKVYFSAYPLDPDRFVIGINDQYSTSSEQVSDIFDLIFNHSKDPRDYGLPKLSSYLAKVLLDLLGGKYHKSIGATSKNESGFVFSTVSSSEKLPPQQVRRELKTEPELQKTDDTFEFKVPAGYAELPAEEEQKQDMESEVRDDSDIFKPVTPIAEELLSTIEREQKEITARPESETEPGTEILNLPEESGIHTPEEEIIKSVTEEAAGIETEPKAESDFTPPLPKLNLNDLSCLYIEDQVDSQILFKVQLKGLKDVRFAVSFEESQSLLLNYQFDFIVIDINLQGEYNGLDALKIIRTMPALSSVPVIAVTAYVLPGDKEKFIAAGFDDFIPKPIFREKMIESLEKIFLSRF